MDLNSEIVITEQIDRGREFKIFWCNNTEWSTPHRSQVMPRHDEKAGVSGL